MACGLAVTSSLSEPSRRRREEMSSTSTFDPLPHPCGVHEEVVELRDVVGDQVGGKSRDSGVVVHGNSRPSLGDPLVREDEPLGVFPKRLRSFSLDQEALRNTPRTSTMSDISASRMSSGIDSDRRTLATKSGIPDFGLQRTATAAIRAWQQSPDSGSRGSGGRHRTPLTRRSPRCGRRRCRRPIHDLGRADR